MKRSEFPIKKHTIRLYEGDTEKLDLFYPELGHNAVIRETVHRLVKRTEERYNRRISKGASDDRGNKAAIDVID